MQGRDYNHLCSHSYESGLPGTRVWKHIGCCKVRGNAEGRPQSQKVCKNKEYLLYQHACGGPSSILNGDDSERNMQAPFKYN